MVLDSEAIEHCIFGLIQVQFYDEANLGSWLAKKLQRRPGSRIRLSTSSISKQDRKISGLLLKTGAHVIHGTFWQSVGYT